MLVAGVRRHVTPDGGNAQATASHEPSDETAEAVGASFVPGLDQTAGEPEDRRVPHQVSSSSATCANTSRRKPLCPLHAPCEFFGSLVDDDSRGSVSYRSAFTRTTAELLLRERLRS